jgi:hypothetical protein
MTIHFGVSGLTKGEWTETDIFYRGNGEIIGASKIDESLLEELRNTEALAAAELELEQPTESMDRLSDRAEQNTSDPTPIPDEGMQLTLSESYEAEE